MTGHQRNLFFLLAITLLQLVCSPVAFSAEIKNVTITQLGNRVLLEFDVEGKEPEADVEIALTIEGRKYSFDSLHLEGDVGKVTPGIGKRVYWNVLQDFPRGFTGEIQWQLLSKGKRAVSGKEVVVLKAAKSKGPVTFDHAKHGKDCAACHHKDKAGAEQKCGKCHGDKTERKQLSAKEAYHTQCKDCHKKMGRGPIKCGECHKK